MRKLLMMVATVVTVQLMIVSVSLAAPLTGGEPGRGTPGGCGSYHTIQYGETLYSLGRHYGVSPHAISEANGLVNPDYIYAGQILYIPCSTGGGYHNPGHHNPGHGHQYPGYGQYPTVGYGYDFTGYYYETYYPNYQRYSYTCGYHFNCY